MLSAVSIFDMSASVPVGFRATLERDNAPTSVLFGEKSYDYLGPKWNGKKIKEN